VTGRRPIAIATVAAVTGVLAGCSPAPLTELPDGVSVSILQNRDDYGVRRLQIAVTNDSTSAITIDRAALRSPRLGDGTAWTRPAEIAPGTTTNLAVSLGDARCDPGLGAGGERVDLRFAVPDGGSGSATVTPRDPFDAISTIIAQDCAQEVAAETVSIELGGDLRVEDRDGHPVALLDVTLAPTGAGSPVTVVSVGRTIMLQPASLEQGWPVGETVTATSAPVTLTLDIVPANCRLHTVAEDKRGTYFPITVDTYAGEGLFYLPASTAVKERFYAYIADYCGWNSDDPAAVDDAAN
jgi:hypothetical protein